MAFITDIGDELNLLGRYGFTIGPVELEWTDEAGLPINISTATFDSTIYTSRSNLTDRGDFDIGLVNTGTDGKFIIQVTPVVCLTLDPGVKMFYVIGVTIAGERKPILYGELEARAA